jgi:hypothetical protein
MAEKPSRNDLGSLEKITSHFDEPQLHCSGNLGFGSEALPKGSYFTIREGKKSLELDG